LSDQKKCVSNKANALYNKNFKFIVNEKREIAVGIRHA